MSCACAYGRVGGEAGKGLEVQTEWEEDKEDSMFGGEEKDKESCCATCV